MQVIDLGQPVTVTVKWAGQEYALTEPSVEAVSKFAEASKEGGGNLIVTFLTDLGMPEEVVKKMGMSKAKSLVDGLMEMLNEKK